MHCLEIFWRGAKLWNTRIMDGPLINVHEIILTLFLKLNYEPYLNPKSSNISFNFLDVLVLHSTIYSQTSFEKTVNQIFLNKRGLSWVQLHNLRPGHRFKTKNHYSSGFPTTFQMVPQQPQSGFFPQVMNHHYQQQQQQQQQQPTSMLMPNNNNFPFR